MALVYWGARCFQGTFDDDIGNLRFRVAPTADLVFLPSGVRLIAGLVFGQLGALGIYIGTFLDDLTGGHMHAESFWELCLVSVPGAISPLIARWYGRKMLGVRPDLSNITPLALTQITLVYSFLSSGGHQLLFALTGASESSWVNWAAMFIGDFVGAMLCIVLMAAALGTARELGRTP